MGFTLRISFRTTEATRISKQSASKAVGRLNFSLESSAQYEIFTVSGFATAEEAKQSLDSFRAASHWLLLEKGLATTTELEPQAVEYHPDPEVLGRNIADSFGLDYPGPIDAVIDGAYPAIYRSEKQIRHLIGGDVELYRTVPADVVLDTLVEGLQFPNPTGLRTDPKLDLALSLYGAYFSEVSVNAKFLTLIMAVEALTVPTPKAAIVRNLLDKWSGELQTLMSKAQLTQDEEAALDSLQRELIFRKDSSIRSQVRELFLEAFSGDSTANETAKKAVALYDIRSKLVHDGEIDENLLNTKTEECRFLVRRLLGLRFRKLVQCLP